MLVRHLVQWQHSCECSRHWQSVDLPAWNQWQNSAQIKITLQLQGITWSTLCALKPDKNHTLKTSAERPVRYSVVNRVNSHPFATSAVTLSASDSDRKGYEMTKLASVLSNIVQLPKLTKHISTTRVWALCVPYFTMHRPWNARSEPFQSDRHPPKNHPKFNPVSFLALLITKDFVMFKALEKL